MHVKYFICNTTLITLIGILTKEFSHALRDVSVNVPHAVRRGEKITLKCFYDIEDDSLYSVKWYKGRREFYRYTPKENPAMKIFQFPGVRVVRYSSNESQLVLDAVTMATSGKYSCEVSADAPSFHTLIAAGELEVIEIPHIPPLITGIRQRYRIGDILRGNCTSRHSKPAANLTWTINNEEVNPADVRPYKILRDTRNDMETSIQGIHLILTEEHFDNDKLHIHCIATIYDIYWKSTAKIIMKASAAKQKHININNMDNTIERNEPYDQYALQDGDVLHKSKQNYLTQLQELFFQFMPSVSSTSSMDDAYDADDTAWRSNSAAASILHKQMLLWPTLHAALYLPRSLIIICLFCCWLYYEQLTTTMLFINAAHHNEYALHRNRTQQRAWQTTIGINASTSIITPTDQSTVTSMSNQNCANSHINYKLNLHSTHKRFVNDITSTSTNAAAVATGMSVIRWRRQFQLSTI